MTTHVMSPALARELATLKQRVWDLERKLADFGREYGPQDILSFPGPVIAQSGPVYEPIGGRKYTALVVTVRVAATSSFTFRLLRSGATFQNFTVPANSTRVAFSISFVVGANENLNGQIVGTGTGGVDVLAHLRY